MTSCFDCNRGKRDTLVIDPSELGEDLESCLRTGDHATAIEILGGDLEVAKRLRAFQEETIVFEFTDAEMLGEQLVAAGKQGAAIRFPNKKSDPESPPPNVPPSAP